MAYMVARSQKHKVGSLNGLQNHVDRKTKNHANKDIDITKSDLNYDLVRDTREKTFLSDVTEYIEKNKTSKRATRKDFFHHYIVRGIHIHHDVCNPFSGF